MVVIAGFGDKIEARLPDAVFVVAQKGLADAKLRSGFSLADALLLPQKGEDP